MGAASATPAVTRIRFSRSACATRSATWTCSPTRSTTVSRGGVAIGDALHDYERRRNEASIAEYRENLHLARFHPVPEDTYRLRAALREDPEGTRQFFLARQGMIPREAFFNPENLQRLLALCCLLMLLLLPCTARAQARLTGIRSPSSNPASVVRNQDPERGPLVRRAFEDLGPAATRSRKSRAPTTVFQCKATSSGLPAVARSECEVRLRQGSGGQPPRDTRAEAGEPDVRQLEPARPVAPRNGWARRALRSLMRRSRCVSGSTQRASDDHATNPFTFLESGIF